MVAVGQLADHAAGAVLSLIRGDDVGEVEGNAARAAAARLCARLVLPRGMLLGRMRHVSEDVRQLQAVLARVDDGDGDGFDLLNRLNRALRLELHNLAQSF